MQGGWVFILTNQPFGVLYIGVTNNLLRRTWEHRQRTTESFTKRYYVTRLVYAEWHDDIRTAIQRETSIKRWPRAWKLDLITEQNPQWEDRYAQLT
ncbi:MAG TPA: GIY-YIG nuclease family protein [Acetobacteraceae bacterium]|jgi:putative endonuclease|nr:GIY-YIG nuclease family protein [Acetobacteraceae bacterium]